MRYCCVHNIETGYSRSYSLLRNILKGTKCCEWEFLHSCKYLSQIKPELSKGTSWKPDTFLEVRFQTIMFYIVESR